MNELAHLSSLLCLFDSSLLIPLRAGWVYPAAFVAHLARIVAVNQDLATPKIRTLLGPPPG
jgi:hypothetical protein